MVQIRGENMFDKLKFNMNRVYPTLVVSTMSSGKSTLINALVGKDLLPSRNRACTAKSIAILDNDRKDNFSIHAVNAKGEYSVVANATKKKVIQYNDTNELDEMILEGQIKGIKNSKKSLLLIDTPGINNSMEQNHALITKRVLDEYEEGLILYVINAQQIGTYDDSNFLSYIVKKINNNRKFKIIFVVNKMDLLDPDKENPDELVKNCISYIREKGIEEPTVIPVSAESALIFKKVLNGEPLSELEEENFIRNYKHFRRKGFSLTDYVYQPNAGDMNECLEVDGCQYTRAEITAALYSTGVTLLENIIDETLVYSLKMRSPKIYYNKSEEVKEQKKDKKENEAIRVSKAVKRKVEPIRTGNAVKKKSIKR